MLLLVYLKDLDDGHPYQDIIGPDHGILVGGEEWGILTGDITPHRLPLRPKRPILNGVKEEEIDKREI